MDWDVATIVEALEELYPLQAEHKHLDFGSRWQQVVDMSVSKVRVQSDRMEQVRSDTIYEWSSGISTIGPIPRNLQTRILTRLAQSFTHRDNPHGNSNPNIAFQRDLDEAMEADDEYRTNPSLPRLCHLLAELAYKWEKIESQSRRMSGSTSALSSDTKNKTSSYERDRDHDKVQPKPIPGTHCMGCNRSGHTRENCHHKNHPDFNGTGPWDGCKADRDFKARGKKLSSREDIDPMVQRYRGRRQEYPLRLLHIVAVIRMTVRDDDATTIDAIVVEAVVVVEGAMSTMVTQVRPVSLVVSLT